MKSNRLVIVLAMIFVLLAALVAYQNSQPPTLLVTTPTPGQSDAPLFPGLTLDQIEAIRLRSPEDGKSFMIDRTLDGAWTAPETPGTLNTDEANNIAKTMIVLPYGESFTLQPGADKTAYGFTPEGILSIEMVLTNGATHVVAVGYRTPTEENYYALVDDRPNLYLLERAAVDYLISRLKSPRSLDNPQKQGYAVRLRVLAG